MIRIFWISLIPFSYKTFKCIWN